MNDFKEIRFVTSAEHFRKDFFFGGGGVVANIRPPPLIDWSEKYLT